MKATILAAGALLALITTGCQSGGAIQMSNNRLAAYQTFQGQEREIENFYLRAPKGQTITISGVEVMRVATEATPLHALPSNPTVAQTAIKEAAGVVKSGVQFAAGAYVLDKAFGAAQKEPVIVEQERLEIIEVPTFGAGNAGLVQ